MGWPRKTKLMASVWADLKKLLYFVGSESHFHAFCWKKKLPSIYLHNYLNYSRLSLPPNSPVLLQLRGRKGGERVLPPAGTPIPSASDGLFGLGGVGDPCIFCRRCRLGPSSSRFSFPGGVGEAAATATP